MKKLLLGVLVTASLLFGAQGDHKAEVMGTISGVKPEGNLDMEDSLALGLRFGTYIEDKFFDMLEFGFERANSVDYEDNRNSTHINRAFVNLVKEYDLSKETALYALAGVGFENVRNAMYENDDDGFVQYGIGVKHWLSDNFALKAEVRHAVTFESNNNLFYTLGFVVPLGQKGKDIPVSKPVVEEKPMPMPRKEIKKVEPKLVDNDTDKDGVVNAQDKCPTTPKNTVVNKDGCVKVIRLHVNFDFDKYNIKNSENTKILKVIQFMLANPDYKVVLDGHTDSRGAKEYNIALGLKRAQAVANVLVNKGISRDKISVNSFGEEEPIVSNESDEGRAQNRRVDAHFNIK